MSKQLRAARRRVLRRSSARCHYCRDLMPARKATLDHAIPRSQGGTYAPENLRPCCPDCNRKKGSRTAVEFFDEIERREMR